MFFTLHFEYTLTLLQMVLHNFCYPISCWWLTTCSLVFHRCRCMTLGLGAIGRVERFITAVAFIDAIGQPLVRKTKLKFILNQLLLQVQVLQETTLCRYTMTSGKHSHDKPAWSKFWRTIKTWKGQLPCTVHVRCALDNLVKLLSSLALFSTSHWKLLNKVFWNKT